MVHRPRAHRTRPAISQARVLRTGTDPAGGEPTDSPVSGAAGRVPRVTTAGTGAAASLSPSRSGALGDVVFDVAITLNLLGLHPQRRVPVHRSPGQDGPPQSGFGKNVLTRPHRRRLPPTPASARRGVRPRVPAARLQPVGEPRRRRCRTTPSPTSHPARPVDAGVRWLVIVANRLAARRVRDERAWIAVA